MSVYFCFSATLMSELSRSMSAAGRILCACKHPLHRRRSQLMVEDTTSVAPIRCATMCLTEESH